MADLLTPEEIEFRARAKGMNLAQLCEAAEIAPSTFTRWKAGQTMPTMAVYLRLAEVSGP
jgi:transcriptional regulator with XRE-family HTH domain